jgi:hypothetical protein
MTEVSINQRIYPLGSENKVGQGGYGRTDYDPRSLNNQFAKNQSFF